MSHLKHKIDLAHARTIAETVAREAGVLVLEAFRKPREASVVTDKSVASIDLVTETDKAAEKLIMERLRASFPDHEFMGEEESSANGGYTLTDAPTWICDPIDGTTNFVHRNPEISVSIGLALNKEPVVGVVFDPCRDELYSAAQGLGATLNGKPISVDKEGQTMSQIVVSTNIGYMRDEGTRRHITVTLDNLMKAGLRGMRMVGSACNSIVSVAVGRTSCFFEQGPHPWDVCAGAVIVREAGGVVMDMSGAALDLCSRKYLVASSQAVASLILPCIAEPPKIK